MYIFALVALLPALAMAQPGGGSISRAIDALFNDIDINNDNQIVLIELEAYFLSFDVNNDGNISHAEFNRAVDHASLGFQGHENQIYNLFDQNDDNTVNRSDIDAVFNKADANNNNHISNQEFHAFINSIPNIIGG